MHIYSHLQSENAAPRLGKSKETDSYKMNKFFSLLCSENVEKHENLRVLGTVAPGNKQ